MDKQINLEIDEKSDAEFLQILKDAVAFKS